MKLKIDWPQLILELVRVIVAALSGAGAASMI